MKEKKEGKKEKKKEYNAPKQYDCRHCLDKKEVWSLTKNRWVRCPYCVK